MVKSSMSRTMRNDVADAPVGSEGGRCPLLGQQRVRTHYQPLAREFGRPLRGAAAIGAALGAMFGRGKVAKHFNVTITDDTFSFARNQTAIVGEAALDGISVVRTNLPAAQSDAAVTVRAYNTSR